MSITNDEQLQQALEQVNLLYLGLAALKADLQGKPQAFALMAEGPLDQITALQSEIEAYTGALRASEQGTSPGPAAAP